MQNSTDLWFCAFLMSRGFEVKKYDVIFRGKARFYFDISEDDWKKYKLEFNNSDLVKYKMLIDQLKDLSY